MKWATIELILLAITSWLRAKFDPAFRKEKLLDDLAKIDEQIKKKEDEIHACSDANSSGYLKLCDELGLLEAKRNTIQAKLNTM